MAIKYIKSECTVASQEVKRELLINASKKISENLQPMGWSTIVTSNVLANEMEHQVIAEGDQGAPYGGFINISDCASVTVRNTILTGCKMYRTIA